MEEGCLISLVVEQTGNATYLVHGGWCQEEGLNEHRNAGENGGHTVDALTTIAVRMAEGDTTGDERIDKWSITFVEPILERLVQSAYVFTSKALDNQDDNILLNQTRIPSNSRLMNRAIDCLKIFFLKVVGHYKDIFADSAVEREGRVEHQSSLYRMVGILIGIADGDGAYSCGKTASDACHPKGNKDKE